MLNFIRALFDWEHFQDARTTIKLYLSALIAETIILVVINTLVLGIFQKTMSSFVSIVGLIWVSATAAAIWFLGGVEVDGLFLARIFKLEVGKEFTKALNIFFLIQSTIVVFFFFIPFWKFWAGFFLLPILILGVTLSGFLTNSGVNWKYFYKGYWALIIFAIGTMILLSVVQFGKDESILSKIKSISFPDISSGFPDIITIFALIAAIALILGLILLLFKKGAAKKLLWVAGIAIVASVIWQIAIHKSIAPGDQTSVQQPMVQATWSGQINWSRAQKYGPIEIPAGETVDTGIPYGPGDYKRFTQLTSYNATFWTLGERGNTFVSERIRILQALPPNPGTICIKAEAKSVRVIIEVIRQT